jgi:hypothetical protein
MQNYKLERKVKKQGPHWTVVPSKEEEEDDEEKESGRCVALTPPPHLAPRIKKE